MKKQLEQNRKTELISLRGVKVMSKNKISPIGDSWDVFEKKIFTPEEIAASDLRVALVGEIVNARQAQ